MKTIQDFPRLAAQPNLTKLIDEMGYDNGWRTMFYGRAEYFLKDTYQADLLDRIAGRVIRDGNEAMITAGEHTEIQDYIKNDAELAYLDRYLNEVFDNYDPQCPDLTNQPGE